MVHAGDAAASPACTTRTPAAAATRSSSARSSGSASIANTPAEPELRAELDRVAAAAHVVIAGSAAVSTVT
ncbi:hypothetical protein MAHJHV57_50580 [Mycobacterium avium subsp. hominissuis]